MAKHRVYTPTDLCPGVVEYGDCDGHLEATTAPPMRGGVVMGMDFASDFEPDMKPREEIKPMPHLPGSLRAALLAATLAADTTSQAFGCLERAASVMNKRQHTPQETKARAKAARARKARRKNRGQR